MERKVIDFTGVKTVWDFHTCFIEPLRLIGNECGMIEGYVYARNFDALWDLLHPRFCEQPTTIVLKGLKNLEKDFDEEVETTKKIFEDLKITDENLTLEYTD